MLSRISYLAAITSPAASPANPRATAPPLNGALNGEERGAAAWVSCSFETAAAVRESDSNAVLQLSQEAASSGFEVLHSGQISTGHKSRLADILASFGQSAHNRFGIVNAAAPNSSARLLQRRPQSRVRGQSGIGAQIRARRPLVEPPEPFLGIESLF